MIVMGLMFTKHRLRVRHLLSSDEGLFLHLGWGLLLSTYLTQDLLYDLKSLWPGRVGSR